MLPSPSLQQPLQRLFQRDALKRNQSQQKYEAAPTPQAPTSHIPAAVFQPPKGKPITKKKGKKQNSNIMPGFEPLARSDGVSKNYNIRNASSVQSEIDKWVASNVTGNSQQKTTADEYPSLSKLKETDSEDSSTRATLYKHSKNKHKEATP